MEDLSSVISVLIAFFSFIIGILIEYWLPITVVIGFFLVFGILYDIGILANISTSQRNLLEEQNRISESQKELLEGQNRISESQKELLEEQNRISESQNELLKEQNRISESQNELLKEQKELLEGLNNISRSGSESSLLEEQNRISQFGDANRFLWDDNLGARMAAIATLWRLAEGYFGLEYKELMDIFTGFLKNPPPYELDKKQGDTLAGKRKDIDAILGYMKRGTIKGAEKVIIDFSGLYLEGADLSYSHLEGADLRDSHLEGADLLSSHLEGADLSYSHLGGANLMGSHLEGSHLMGSHLEGSHLESSHLEGADLESSHLEGSHLMGSHLEGADFNSSHLEGANFESAHLFDVDLSLSIINGADFMETKGLTQEQIDECVFITDSEEQRLPKLPEGINPTYKKVTHEEWKKEKEKYFKAS